MGPKMTKRKTIYQLTPDVNKQTKITKKTIENTVKQHKMIEITQNDRKLSETAKHARKSSKIT